MGTCIECGKEGDWKKMCPDCFGKSYVGVIIEVEGEIKTGTKTITVPLSEENFKDLKKGKMVGKQNPSRGIAVFIGKKQVEKELEEARELNWTPTFIPIDDEKIKALETTSIALNFQYDEFVIEVMSLKTCNELYGSNKVERGKREAEVKLKRMAERVNGGK